MPMPEQLSTMFQGVPETPAVNSVSSDTPMQPTEAPKLSPLEYLRMLAPAVAILHNQEPPQPFRRSIGPQRTKDVRTAMKSRSFSRVIS